MDNPYEPPRSPVRMVGDDASALIRSTVAPYAVAIFRAGFVTFVGLSAEVFLVALLGDWAPPLPRPVVAVIELVPVGLGVAMGWWSLHRSGCRVGAK